MAKKNGKKKLIEMTSKFYESKSEVEEPKLTLLDLGLETKTYLDYERENTLLRFEKQLQDYADLFNIKSVEGWSIITEKAISIDTDLSVAEIFDVLTDVLKINNKDLGKFFESLHRGAKDFFREGL